ncbi:MAG: 16S rRNA (guanine(966)-N(2))-methyltransferase RsmD [Candidatus Hydrogenedens sp.]|nr:16S rRNA (guanine(966)-N(2))-methyltransferase RsmD [Candidatus Hydrogenedens sp.]
MRVIAGSARGTKLFSPEGNAIRPTLDRVREALFNMLGPSLEDARFLDLFAGTGANGIEALSRGAAECVFVDLSRDAHRIQRENLLKTRLAADAQTLTLELPRDIARIPGDFDLIFADPPYDYAHYPALLEAAGQRLLRPGGSFVIEHQRRVELPDNAGGLVRTKFKHYGDVALSVYEHPESAG